MKNKSYKLFCSGDLLEPGPYGSLHPSEARSLIKTLGLEPGGTDNNAEGRSLMRLLLRGCETDTESKERAIALEQQVSSLSSSLDQQQQITRNLLELFIISVGGTPPKAGE